MANPRKPTHLKAVAGTDRPDRREQSPGVELPLLADLPPAPLWLPNPHAVQEWDRLVRILMANKLLTEADLTALAHLCALHGKCVQLYAAGEAPTASMIGIMRNLQNDFGLAPVARGKVKPVAEPDKANPFAANKRSRPA